MSIQQIAILLSTTLMIVIITSEAFLILPHGSTPAATVSRQYRTVYASAPVFMSETAETTPSTSDVTTDVASSTDSVEAVQETVIEEVISDTTTAMSSSNELEMTAEEAAAKRKVQRERYTLFVGNLPFGTFSFLVRNTTS
jgi:hypothetical protein